MENGAESQGDKSSVKMVLGMKTLLDRAHRVPWRPKTHTPF